MELPEVIYFQTVTSDKFQIVDVAASLAGALVGGLIVFLTQVYFETKRKRQDIRERDFELYLVINEFLNDIYGLASAYGTMLGREYWPINPLGNVRPVLAPCPDHIQAHSRLLSTFFWEAR